MTRPRELSDASLRGARVTVLGLGRFGGGIGVTRWLCSKGANVTVSDLASADKLRESVEQLDGLDVTLHLGEQPDSDFTDADWIVVNPAVPDNAPALEKARKARTPLTTEINLFLERCPCPILGVTGTVGKSTTTAMLGKALATKYTTHVGGNIGKCLLEDLENIRPDHRVVLELSSFQLERIALIERSPQIALVTNIAPNHLDRHKTMSAYADAKKNIFRYQSQTDTLILNAADERIGDWSNLAPGKVEWFDPASAERFNLNVPGDHNQANAKGACKAAEVAGVSREQAALALEDFDGLPHRLQFVTQRDGVRYFNDSKCTTPEGVAVALAAFPQRRVILIAGGYDKGVSFEPLAKPAAQRCKALILIGATREKIQQCVREYESSPGENSSVPISFVDDVPKAVRAAQNVAENGDVVLLSPACASYDMFENYEQRGKAFAEAARDMHSE